jgi:hypothetical protein
MVDSLLPPKRDPRTPGPLRKRQPNRLIRSIMLGTVAVVFAVYWIGRSYDVDWAEIRLYALASLAFVGLFIGAAMLVWGLVRLLPRMLRALFRR